MYSDSDSGWLSVDSAVANVRLRVSNSVEISSS